MKPKSPNIYTITAIKKVFAILDHRVIGFFYDRKDAVLSVEKNHDDIYEYGAYPYVVIEEVPEGQYPHCEKSWWYTWKDSGYKKSRKPRRYKNAVNFGIG